MISDIAAGYRRRAADFAEQRQEAEQRSRRLATFRVLTFVAAFLALAVRAFSGPALDAPLAVGAAVAAVAFFVLIAVHRRVRRKVERLQVMEDLNREGSLRLKRDWSSLPDPAPTHVDGGHGYAADLHVSGHASLLHLLGTVATEPGRGALSSWLLAPSGVEEIVRRQAAVAELAPSRDFRDRFAAEGRLADPASPEALSAFLDWAEEEPWLLGRTARLIGAFILPVLTLALFAVYFDQADAAPWWIFPLLGQVFLVQTRARRIQSDFDRAGSGEAGVQSYAPLLELVLERSFESPLLQELEAELRADGGASSAVDSLVRRLGWADARRSWLHPFLNYVLLWDHHVQVALERWKRLHGRRVRRWIEALGEMDGLATLATLSHDHPDWCTPELWSEPRMVAEDLGHPLLAPDGCVRNDVTVGPPGSFLLITGSNMSGKSTLLRALGCNVVLALAGGPVCASACRLPVVELWTSMQVSDSLEDGVSLFMAELRRLSSVVEAAREAEVGGPPVFYLLDEILQGTNTAERQIAARTVLRHLLNSYAVGAVTTHDLTLADARDLEARAVMVHLSESVDRHGSGPALHFDYRLRSGIATSTNALELLELVGLGGDGEGRLPKEGEEPSGRAQGTRERSPPP